MAGRKYVECHCVNAFAWYQQAYSSTSPIPLLVVVNIASYGSS